MSKYAKQIADLQATRKSKSDRMKAIQDKATEQSRTLDAGEQEEFDTLKGELSVIDKNIGNLRDLEAIEKAGIPVPYSCRVGGCGTCELRVIRGDIDHRDHCLPPEDRAAGRSLISCVSRAANGELVLDL